MSRKSLQGVGSRPDEPARSGEPSGRSWRLAWRSIVSPTGKGRTENQDNLLLIDRQGQATFLRDEQPVERVLDEWTGAYRRLAVLDGMGGHRDGREVAEAVVEGLLAIPAGLDDAAWDQALGDLHRSLYAHFAGGPRSPGATLTLLDVAPDDQARLFHVGDTRLYEVTDTRVECLTVDHVPATRFAMLGLIEEQEWLDRVHRESSNLISQAFVLGNSLEGPAFEDDELRSNLYELNDQRLPGFLQGKGDRRSLRLRSGRAYLLISDGLLHLPSPMAFVQRWPAMWRDSGNDVETFATALLAEQRAITLEEQLHSEDNTSLVVFSLGSEVGDD